MIVYTNAELKEIRDELNVCDLLNMYLLDHNKNSKFNSTEFVDSLLFDKRGVLKGLVKFQKYMFKVNKVSYLAWDKNKPDQLTFVSDTNETVIKDFIPERVVHSFSSIKELTDSLENSFSTFHNQLALLNNNDPKLVGLMQFNIFKAFFTEVSSLGVWMHRYSHVRFLVEGISDEVYWSITKPKQVVINHEGEWKKLSIEEARLL